MSRFDALRNEAWLNGYLVFCRGRYQVHPKPDLNALLAEGIDVKAYVRSSVPLYSASNLVDVAKWLTRQHKRRGDMVQVPTNFDDYADKADFAPVPRGDYWMILKERKDQGEYENNEGTGTYLKAVFTISRDPYKNRKIFENFNVGHNNLEARDIGWGMIYAWARACGIQNIRDTTELIGREFKAHVVIKPSDKPQYSDQNAIRFFIARDKAGNPEDGNNVADKPSGARAASEPTKPAATEHNPFNDEIKY
jgi:hypothetical protein